MRGWLIRGVLLLVVVGTVSASAAMAASVATHSKTIVKTAKTSSFGKVLVGSNGHTLYRFTADSKGVNRCSNVAACNKAWPALLVKAGVKPTAGPGAKTKLLGTIRAAHGMRQVTYRGFPLYFFSGDSKAGQTNGEGLVGKWFVVSTSGALVRHAMKASNTSKSTSTGSSGGSHWG
jgi:predicted lipoprotein with Yx(FWY)xxD motif